MYISHLPVEVDGDFSVVQDTLGTLDTRRYSGRVEMIDEANHLQERDQQRGAVYKVERNSRFDKGSVIQRNPFKNY